MAARFWLHVAGPPLHWRHGGGLPFFSSGMADHVDPTLSVSLEIRSAGDSLFGFSSQRGTILPRLSLG